MRTKKRRKSSRFHGSQTAHRGAKERTRGSGNRGGKGMAGTGKRADQKKTLVIKLFGNDYFGKDKTLRRGQFSSRLKAINAGDVQDKLSSLMAEKKAKADKDSFSVDLTGYKILGDGEVSVKLNIIASAASPSAHEKINAAGGSIKLAEEKNSQVKEESKKEAKVEDKKTPKVKKK